jgi:hypothetical protein
MARCKQNFVVDMEVVYVPMPAEHVEKWRAGVSLLLHYLKEAKLKEERKEMEVMQNQSSE